MRRFRCKLMLILLIALFLPTTLYWSYYDNDMNRPIREQYFVGHQTEPGTTIAMQTSTDLSTVITPLRNTDNNITARHTELPSTPAQNPQESHQRNHPLPLRRFPIADRNQLPPPQPKLHHYSTTPQPIPFMGNYNCTTDTVCHIFLTGDDLYYSRRCGGSRFGRASCHYMNGKNRYPVALASFPGSGNTWVRGLLEQATGICTGSIYCDGSLKSSGMVGEYMRSGVVLVTKTHEGRPAFLWNSTITQINEFKLEDLPFGAAILIVRNPFDALVAERTRQKSGGSHTRQPVNDPLHYDQYWVETYTNWWKAMITSWILSNAQNKPILVVRFEDLKADWMAEVKKMLKFLQVPYSDELLQNRMGLGYTKFQRPHRQESDNLDHFTPKLKQYVLDSVQDVCEELKRTMGETYGIEEYLITT